MKESPVRTTVRLTRPQFHLVQHIAQTMNVVYAQVIRNMVDYVAGDLVGFFEATVPHAEKLARDVKQRIDGLPVVQGDEVLREKNRQLRDELTEVSRKLQLFAHEAQKNKLTSVAQQSMDLSSNVLNIRDKMEV